MCCTHLLKYHTVPLKYIQQSHANEEYKTHFQWKKIQKHITSSKIGIQARKSLSCVHAACSLSEKPKQRCKAGQERHMHK